MSDERRASDPNATSDELETTAERRSGFLRGHHHRDDDAPGGGGDVTKDADETALGAPAPAGATVNPADTGADGPDGAARARTSDAHGGPVARPDAQDSSGNAGPAAEDEPATPEEKERAETAVLLAGASVLPGGRSRAAAHVWSVVLSLLLLPLAWYLIADGGARLALADGPWDTGELNVAALLELAAGLLVLAVPLLAARASSLGATISGALITLLGLPFLIVPARTRDVVGPLTEQLADWHQIGANAAHHFLADATTGRLVMYGFVLIFLGVVSHGARRQGRREEKARFDRARNREIASRRMAESRRRSAEHRRNEVERRGTSPA